ncbi:NAD(P)-dependent oxidoreductase [Nocardioides sp.]|uniref:NAD-dependent epimerase/dehydratase family protein n=1 Tax=Nocardioides sp. TaxID=35761 RepID=UPI002619553A|nr:NAD-dependent epimerase/dehydratase family protein [Nocardioides sp.]
MSTHLPPQSRILVVGGTGMIGQHVARLLAEQGNDVTIAGRNAPAEGSWVEGFAFLEGDYATGGLTVEELTGFDAVVFAAGQDIRHAGGPGDDDFWRTYQIEGVPNIAARAKAAGVKRFVQIGSYYHQVRPDLVSNEYVAARKAADDGARALSDETFAAITLNPPSIVGAAPGGSVKQLKGQLRWANGDLAGKIPDFAPAGGTNYMSVRSVAEAVSGALARGEGGTAYLIGDENLRFVDFFNLVFAASGSGRVLEERDEEHPFLPDWAIVPGRGNVVAYEPDADEVALLGYRRGDVAPMIAEMVAALD